MALRFFDGFDGYATADITKRWNATTGAHSIQTGGRFGANVLRVASGGGGEWHATSTSTANSSGTSASPSSSSARPAAADSGRSSNSGRSPPSRSSLALTRATGCVAQRGGVALSGCTGTTTLSTGSWYYVELGRASMHQLDGGGGRQGVSRRHPGVLVQLGRQHRHRRLGCRGSDRLSVGSSWANNSNHLSWDDLYVCDGTGSRNNAVLGDMRVETLLPDGAGNYQQFALTGAASSQAAVNENPNNGDTSYVSSFTPGQYETFTFGNMVSAPKSIAGIQLTAVCRKDDAGTRIISPVYRISGSDYVSPGQAVLDSYAFAIDIQELNPATSAVWTATTVNALEAGIKLVS
jgi:hypothetical protein